MLNRLTYTLGISIAIDTKIGSGLYSGHFDGIVVNGKSSIGMNCNDFSRCYPGGGELRGKTRLPGAGRQ